MNQRLWEEAKKLADAFVAAVYSSDAGVEADVQLQAWVAAAADPTQGNVPKLFDGGISTIAEVTALLTYMIYLPIAHTVQNLPIYIAGSFSEVLLPSAAMNLALPDPTQTYTMENLLDEWLPSAFAVGKTCTFVGIALLRYVDEMGMAPDAPPENPPWNSPPGSFLTPFFSTPTPNCVLGWNAVLSGADPEATYNRKVSVMHVAGRRLHEHVPHHPHVRQGRAGEHRHHRIRGRGSYDASRRPGSR